MALPAPTIGCARALPYEYVRDKDKSTCARTHGVWDSTGQKVYRQMPAGHIPAAHVPKELQSRDDHRLANHSSDPEKYQ